MAGPGGQWSVPRWVLAQPSYQPPAALQQFNPLGGLGAFPSQQPPQTNPANNPFLADAGLGGQLGGLNLGGASQAPLWQ